MLKSFNLVNKYKNKNNDIFNYILNNKKLYNYYLNFIYFSKFNNNYLLNNSLIIQNTDTVKDLELKNQKSLFFLNKKGLMNYFNNKKIAGINNNSSINYNINNFNFNRYRFTNNNNNSLFRGICNDYFN